MPKMRGIKPEIWTDDKFVELSPLARLLFIGLWNYACDNGHVENKPLQLKMRILPADSCDVAELVAEIAAKEMVGVADGYLTVPNLPTHQRIDKRYFTSCDHCDPAEVPESAQRVPAGRTAGTQSAHALKEGRKEGEGEGESGAAGAPRAKRATQLPDSWKPNTGHLSFAAENDVILGLEADKFRDHHAARGSTMKDWDAAFRNWLRNSVTFRARDAGPTPPIRNLPRAHELEQPPDNLNPAEYAEWDRKQRERRKRA